MKNLFTSHRLIVALFAALFTLTLHNISNAQTQIHVDAVNGINARTGRGSAANPYKSITYALLISGQNNLPEPWHVHIHPGTYDANPAKPATDREIFPIKLRDGMIFEGTTTAAECIIDGQHVAQGLAILLGDNVGGVNIRNLTLRDLHAKVPEDSFPWGNLKHGRTVAAQIILGGSGEHNTNTLERCIVSNKVARLGQFGSGLWTNIPLVLTENTFSNNPSQGVTVWTDTDVVANNNTFSDNDVVANNNTFSDNKVTGLYISDHSTGHITENTFRNNGWSGGLYIEGRFNGNINGNVFSGNRNSGLYIYSSMTGDITYNTFENNTSEGNASSGGFYIRFDMTGDIAYNKFIGNSAQAAGAAYIAGKLTGKITHNIFDSNVATYHAGFSISSQAETLEISNNIFYNNIPSEHSVHSSSISVYGPAHILNNLFIVSDGTLTFPVVKVSSSESQVHNNIFSGMHTAIFIDGDHDLPITHNIFHNIGQDIVQQSGSGVGKDLAFWELFAENASNNLVAVPLFVDPLIEKDFHLKAGSPAIDAGTDLHAPADDFDGVARPVGGTADIGPYEYKDSTGQTIKFLPEDVNGEVAIYTGEVGWITKEGADKQAQICIDRLNAAGIPNILFDSEGDTDALANWMKNATGNGRVDVCILYGDFPSSIYPAGNALPDGSIAEAFIESTDGDAFINHADWMFWGAGKNTQGGLQNMMDIAGITMWGNNTPMTVTEAGKTIAPSLTDFVSHRPFHVDELAGDWEVEAVLARNHDGTRADPIIVRDGTRGRLIPIMQTVGDDNPQGAVAAEVISYLMSKTSDTTVGPLPTSETVNIPDANLTKWHLPEGAMSRLGKGTVNEITYSPDGSLLAVASSIGIWLYDADSGAALNLITGHTGRVFSVVFSPDGQTLASGGSHGPVRLWDVQTGVEKQILKGHTAGGVYSVVFSPDGETIASGGWDGTVRLWDVQTGVEKQSLTGHEGVVLSVSFSPDGQTIASGGSDKTVRLWDVQTGVEKQSLTGHTGSISSVVFSPDGQTIASGSPDETVRLWDVQTGVEKQRLTGHNSDVNSVVFSPDGETIASGSWDGTVRLWDVQTGIEKQKLIGHTWAVYSVVFSPDGETIASGSWDGTVRLWDVQTGVEKRTLTGHTNAVRSVSFSPDGQTIASGSYETIHLWDVQTGLEKRSLTGHTSLVTNVAFSPDGETIASRSWRNTVVHLWDVQTGVEKRTLTGHTDSVNSVVFSPDGETIASSSVDKTIRLWDVQTGAEKQSLTGHEGVVISVSFSPDGQTIASSSGDKTIRLWDVQTGVEKQTLTGHTDLVFSVSFSPDGQTIASGSVDKTIRLWDVRTGIQKQTLTGHRNWVRSVVFSPDGETIASSSTGYTVRLWDVQTGVEKQMLTGHTNSVESVVFSPDGQTLASGSSDGTVLLWDMAPEAPQPQPLAADVNADGIVNIQDLVRVAANFGATGENAADVNGDGVTNIIDLTLVAAALGQTAASPSVHATVLEHFTASEVEQWLQAAQRVNLTDPTFQRGIRFLKQLLKALIPKETALLANYPNPFNPETWIPYQLSKPTEVSIAIYTANGQLVRVLALGTQSAGMYQHRSRAAYWDGKNEVGEPVASGIYFYTLTAGDFTATRKMLIRK